jgi:chromosome segregation protein
MRLERLEINGFKSFSDRSELAFDKGVTAIVGPNGCGKSNVADAITWVMGEQSAKSLRGDKMEDVIFSGSDARKATSSAEVRLRFSGVLKTLTGPAFVDEPAANGHHFEALGANEQPHGANGHHPHPSRANGNGNCRGAGVDDAMFPVLARLDAEELIQSVAREVEVTRRLYRSGESEYLIDGRVCRLRDIHDLLMDTGLGAKAYAIIEQGKIGLILSSRPTERRQLIEEAAGVTKYRARRRTAGLKLEAARQNLTRVDDIVFEVEKQRGTLKRQASKARRYQKLRDEMRRLEKVLFARKYRQLAETIDGVRRRLSEARERESLAAARVSEVESDFGRVRIELALADARATDAREATHARELAINRRQHQILLETEQMQALTGRASAVSAEIETLMARRAPARAAIEARRAAAADANSERDRAALALTTESEAYEAARRDIEGLEADVEGARGEVFSAINSATALRHSIEHAASAHDRVLETLSNLQIEADDLRIEGERIHADQTAAADGLRRAQEAMEATRVAKSARESELASARIEHEWRARTVRMRDHELAGLDARLKSLEELQAGRAEYGDAARTLLGQANGRVAQQGAIADYLEVETGYERAVEACLGDLLQHVIVERSEHAANGVQLVRERQAGRCGFLIASPSSTRRDVEPGEARQAESASTIDTQPSPLPHDAGLVRLSSVVRVDGPFAGAIRQAIGEGWVAESYARAETASAITCLPVVTAAGDVFRGPHLVSGGRPQEARGILETKREIRDLVDRVAADRNVLSMLAQETAGLESVITQASHAIAALNAEQHRHEKVIVALDAQSARASADATRIAQKSDQLARERRRGEEERDALERRQEEARSSIVHLERQQRLAEERLTDAQRCLLEAREAMEELSRRAADAGAAHAALVERTGALAAEVGRLEEAATDLEVRAAALVAELDATRRRVDELLAGVASGETMLDADVRVLESVRSDLQAIEAAVSSLRTEADQFEAAIKIVRSEFEDRRSEVAGLDIARVTAEGELTHLATTCAVAVQSSLDDVLVEVETLEREGNLSPDASVVFAEDPDEASDEEPTAAAMTSQEGSVAEQQALSAEDAIVKLRGKIDRLGPVNMMAIEQYDDLEARYLFLSSQRKDLVDAIAQTSEAIKRIDETTRHRFNEAFVAINKNFQEMFNTLFGGGRAGLTLLDDNDPLESGIEIVAQPPGKRLQSVQLLSGGEKALTAIALMFGLFKYKPSPFCLLDEIDAPLDDANVGRFVEMLRGMQQHTQFILITHNRKTMEIADRLYGVTMEEPGVSKLISVQLN